MDQLTALSLNLLGLAIFLGMGAFGVASIGEGEKRAARIAFSMAVVGAAIFFGLAFLSLPVKLAALGLLLAAAILFIILFWLPIGRVAPGGDIPSKRFDERNIMFARSRLKPGSPEYLAYYADHPENEKKDNLTRSKPGLLSPKARFAEPYLFASTDASFFLTHALRKAVDGPVAEEKLPLSIEKITAYLKDLTRFYGALEVGITELEPYHFYSHIGRGEGVYGEPIEIEHTHALAFTVEMDFAMIGPNPRPTGMAETAKEYVESARIAVQLAAALRLMGYSARAHIDGNYRVIAPLVARDAGLGEIGRMSILMTPDQGPRVRLGVVTTDLELLPDPRNANTAMIDFCNICVKCAECCPSRSISFEERQEVDGALRWRIDPDTCFRYWNIAGTDCGRCMTVCPYAHPNTFFHNVVRWGAARSGFFRRMVNWMDDLFYGVKPAPRDAPAWTRGMEEK